MYEPFLKAFRASAALSVSRNMCFSRAYESDSCDIPVDLQLLLLTRKSERVFIDKLWSFFVCEYEKGAIVRDPTRLSAESL